MSVSPEQQLRAYVDYLRDLGIYDLYRRDEPMVELPETLRTALNAKAAQVPATATKPPVSAPPVKPQVPSRAAVLPQPQTSQQSVANPPAAPATQYFASESVASLPPEL